MARLAYSLETLRSEVDARWPHRNKASDGWIGDPAHQATPSDHNPNAAGVVCALDITNDPLTGPTAQYLFDTIRAHPQIDAKYIIANQHIASKTHGWTVRPYSGDPHTSHIHVSVGVGSDGQSQQPYDDRDPWLSPVPPPPSGDDDIMVLHIVVGDTDPQRRWWVTDLYSYKTYIPTPQAAGEIVFYTLAGGGKITQDGSNGPNEVSWDLLQNIPNK